MVHKKNSAGFTLIEVLISLFIFGILMIATSQIFASSFRGYRYTRAVQKDVETAQFAMNLLAKELRTSSIVYTSVGQAPTSGTVDTTWVKFFDYSRNKCVRYDILNNSLQVKEDDMPDYATCLATGITHAYTTLTTGNVAGHFLVQSSDISSSPKRVGKVTIYLDINESSTHQAHIQTTVSLRDYGFLGF